MPANDTKAEQTVQALLMRYCASFFLLGMRDAEQGDRVEYSYQVRLLDPACQQDVVLALKKDGSFGDPVMLMQRTTVEL